MSPTKLTMILASLLLVAAVLTVAVPRWAPAAPADELRGKSPPPVDSDATSGPAEMKRLQDMTPDQRALVKANDDFALDLYTRLAGEEQGQNLFFSPYSVSSAMTLVVEGARGETAEQIGKVLRYPDVLHHKGDELLPWDTGRIHAGMATLNDHFTSGSKAPPKEIRARLDALRSELKAANRRAAELGRARDWQAQEAAAMQSQKIAAELNRLQVRYSQYELRIANALWGEKSYDFRQSYLDALHKHYPTGGFFPVDFRHDYEGARRRINDWVEGQTRERIKDMIPKDLLDEEAKKLVRLVLTNAIYFRGEWAEVFQEAQTKDDDFTRAGGKKVRVPMMRRDDMPSVRYAAFRGDGTFFDTPTRVPLGSDIDPNKVYPDERGLTLLEMPYKGGEVSMVLIVPRSADGLAGLEMRLTSANVRSWFGELRQRGVHVFVPKFKLETKYALEKSFRAMGMVRAFEDPRLPEGAQFDGMSASEDPAQKLYVSKVLHKAFVEVNEKGTEAAAATAVLMARPTEAEPQSVPFTPTFRADRPFVFLIRDVRTGSILFVGRMMNPRQNG
jgi:serine protease inhibitor